MRTTSAVEADNKWLLLSSLLLIGIVGLLYYIRFENKPSYYYLGRYKEKDELGMVTESVTFALLPQRGSQVSGNVNVREVNGMIVMLFTLNGTPVNSPMLIRIYKGTCGAIGKKYYSLPSIKRNSEVGWMTMYDVNWKRFMREMPLALMMETSGDTSMPLSCADMSIEI